MTTEKKTIILKIVHIISYVLSALFVCLCISLGLASCHLKTSNKPKEKQTQQRVDIENDTYKYFLAPKSTITTYFNDWDDYILTLTEGCQIFTYANAYDIWLAVGDSMVLFNNEVISNRYDSLRFEYWYSPAPNNDLVCTRVYLYDSSNNSTLEIYGNRIEWQYRPVSLYIDSLSWAGNSNFEPYPDRASFSIRNFLSLYYDIYENEGLAFTFDINKINPIELFSYEIMNTNVAHNMGSWTGHIDLDMIFTSNGFLFKKMRFQVDYVLGVYYNEELTLYDDMTYLALSYIAYQDYYTEEWIKVCFPRIYKYETRSLSNSPHLYPYPFTDFKTYLWTTESYKSIDIVSGADNVFSTLPADPIANLTNWQVLNYKNTYNNVGTTINDIGGSNVFTLLASAFSSVASLFAIQILPGITLGLLMFLPLVVGIIIAIIWIVKR